MTEFNITKLNNLKTSINDNIDNIMNNLKENYEKEKCNKLINYIKEISQDYNISEKELVNKYIKKKFIKKKKITNTETENDSKIINEIIENVENDNILDSNTTKITSSNTLFKLFKINNEKQFYLNLSNNNLVNSEGIIVGQKNNDTCILYKERIEKNKETIY